jgi:hypothetical protein
MSNSRKEKPVRRQEDDSVFSKNYSKSMKYRLRIQRQREAEEELKEFKNGDIADAGTEIQDNIR